jgi:hypothetical protein
MRRRRQPLHSTKQLRPLGQRLERRNWNDHHFCAQAGAWCRHRGLTLLQSARAELAQATPNKGGHRERALGLIDQAISEVRAGIAFAAGG